MPKVKGQKSSKVMLSKKEAKAVRGLIQGDTKQSAVLVCGPTVLGTTRSYCVTSGAAAGSASQYSGLLATDGDSAVIKSLEISGYMDIAPLAKTAGSTLESCVPVTVRELLVWFYKPMQVAVAGGGSLPPITEVLVEDNVGSMYVDDSANAGRFKVLSDKKYRLGSNVYVTDLSLKETTIGRIYCANKILIGKTQHFKENAVPGVYGTVHQGGHYDTNADAGQVTRGLCMLYYVSEGNAGTFTADMNMRLTYVG